MKKNIIKHGKHVFICGQNGCGKTVLAGTYLANEDNVIMYDTKGVEDWKQTINTPIFEHLEDLKKFGEGRAIYRPHFTELNPDYANELFKWVYFRKNTSVWIDEVMSICPNSSTVPEYYKACLTRGRARGISCWSLTQRPKSIPLVIMSESHHFFIFDLNLLDDRKRVNEFIGDPEILITPTKKVGKKFHFWYYDSDLDNPQLGTLVQK